MPFAAVFDPKENFAERKRQLMDRARQRINCATPRRTLKKRPTEDMTMDGSDWTSVSIGNGYITKQNR
jgi:hypothetical protein